MRWQLWLVAEAVAVLALSTPSATAAVTPVCERDETEAIVAIMASLLVDPNCLGVADEKCPRDAHCLSRLALVVHKMPACLSSASNTHKSQRARLQVLIDTCKAPAPISSATPAYTSGSAAGNESPLNETSVRSTAPSAAAAASLSISMCGVGVLLAIVPVALV